MTKNVLDIMKDWTLIKKTTGTASASIDLTGYTEVLITTQVTVSSVSRKFYVSIPVALIGADALIYMSGGYQGSNAGALCNGHLSSTAFQLTTCVVNGTATTNTAETYIYAR